MTYAGFWRQLGAAWIDILCFVPLIWLAFWMNNQYRYFELWYFIPGILIGLWFHIYLVKRYGGTPGKLLLGMRILRIDGTPVGYKEAFLRNVVNLLLTAASSAGIVMATLAMTDAEYFALDWQARTLRLNELAPSWYSWITILTHVWVWGEFVVMMTTKDAAPSMTSSSPQPSSPGGPCYSRKNRPARKARLTL